MHSVMSTVKWIMRSSDIGSDGVDLVPNQCAGLEAGPAVSCDLIHNPDNMICSIF